MLLDLKKSMRIHKQTLVVAIGVLLPMIIILLIFLHQFPEEAVEGDVHHASEIVDALEENEVRPVVEDVPVTILPESSPIHVVSNDEGVNHPIYQEALSLFQHRHYHDAVVLLRDNQSLLLSTQGLSGVLLARIYLAIDKYRLAENVVDQTLSLHIGPEVELISLKAQALFLQKRYQAVVSVLSSISPDLSGYPYYYVLLANTYMDMHQPLKAVSIFQQVVARFPDVGNYWLALAVAYQKTGDAPSALVAYRRAAQLSIDNPSVVLFIDEQIHALSGY